MIYIALDDMNLDWMPADVKLFDQLWKEGVPVKEIARKLKRPAKEVVILLYDRASKGKVKPRKGGLEGELTN